MYSYTCGVFSKVFGGAHLLLQFRGDCLPAPIKECSSIFAISSNNQDVRERRRRSIYSRTSRGYARQTSDRKSRELLTTLVSTPRYRSSRRAYNQRSNLYDRGTTSRRDSVSSVTRDNASIITTTLSTKRLVRALYGRIRRRSLGASTNYTDGRDGSKIKSRRAGSGSRNRADQNVGTNNSNNNDGRESGTSNADRDNRTDIRAITLNRRTRTSKITYSSARANTNDSRTTRGNRMQRVLTSTNGLIHGSLNRRLIKVLIVTFLVRYDGRRRSSRTNRGDRAIFVRKSNILYVRDSLTMNLGSLASRRNSSDDSATLSHARLRYSHGHQRSDGNRHSTYKSLARATRRISQRRVRRVGSSLRTGRRYRAMCYASRAKGSRTLLNVQTPNASSVNNRRSTISRGGTYYGKDQRTMTSSRAGASNRTNHDRYFAIRTLFRVLEGSQARAVIRGDGTLIYRSQHRHTGYHSSSMSWGIFRIWSSLCFETSSRTRAFRGSQGSLFSILVHGTRNFLTHLSLDRSLLLTRRLAQRQCNNALVRSGRYSHRYRHATTTHLTHTGMVVDLPNLSYRYHHGIVFSLGHNAVTRGAFSDVVSFLLISLATGCSFRAGSPFCYKSCFGYYRAYTDEAPVYVMEGFYSFSNEPNEISQAVSYITSETLKGMNSPFISS